MNNIPADVQDFLDALAIEQNCSSNTITSYRRNLKQFFDWLESNNSPTCIDELHPMILRKYIAYLKGRVKHISIKQKIATLKSFFRFLKENTPDINLPHIPKHIKKERTQIKTLSTTEIHTLLDAVSKRKKEIEHTLTVKSKNTSRLHKQLLNCRRDLVILILLVGTGMRVGELTALDISDIDFGTKTITVHGKRNKLREVFFDIPSIESALLDYFNWRNTLDIEHNALFINSKDHSRITPRSIQRLLKLYLDMAGLPSEITPHSLRHSYATISIEKGANIKAISQLLGHSHIGTTLEYYTHISKEHLRAVYKQSHPDTPNDIPLSKVMENRKSILTNL
ncbi:MAG: tyrosine-type recombinase/integrase [Firmicutes bacterium]|nr:tyrosine-type recombinase/integrase [Bacillota bacterium]